MPPRLYTPDEVTAILECLAAVEREEVAPKAGPGPFNTAAIAAADALESYAKSWRVWMPEELRPA